MSTYVLLVSCTELVVVLATRHGEPAQTLRRASPYPSFFLPCHSGKREARIQCTHSHHAHAARSHHFPSRPRPLSPACLSLRALAVTAARFSQWSQARSHLAPSSLLLSISQRSHCRSSYSSSGRLSSRT
jgi:hypothetical protein